jgi:hypothetical protein
MFEVFTAPSELNAFKLLPAVMDFMRKVALFKGKVMFVEEKLRNPRISGRLA